MNACFFFYSTVTNRNEKINNTLYNLRVRRVIFSLRAYDTVLIPYLHLDKNFHIEYFLPN